ncbi:antitoxin component of MazEF toxin-antitoxin module [Ochrobactrum daejeonense]|uniref:Antitoxin component of MazEF toxin-antitoxin module n=1 Tax=Brucella daejeonensis TaxID=659015 RepID=A0A7W9B010_9HYPH|nr:AbrB/MazE/SpoVT family DNA-binding domain-containing protein [Brucella daejeonensis]MBB5703745.1 antitoxin component of MazEF toxin-antitoxin module [Brucella daejeonensis]NKB78746.1 AbrB/MazE/SpoVT family DNA-binding domain-containing protein [Brucella daejeonensis]
MRIMLEAVGDDVGFVLPEHILEMLGAKTGDTLKLTEFPDGFSIELSDETFERQTALLGYQPERCKFNLHKIEHDA